MVHNCYLTELCNHETRWIALGIWQGEKEKNKGKQVGGKKLRTLGRMAEFPGQMHFMLHSHLCSQQAHIFAEKHHVVLYLAQNSLPCCQRGSLNINIIQKSWPSTAPISPVPKLSPQPQSSAVPPHQAAGASQALHPTPTLHWNFRREGAAGLALGPEFGATGQQNRKDAVKGLR